jgi:hypothetical protein
LKNIFNLIGLFFAIILSACADEEMEDYGDFNRSANFFNDGLNGKIIVSHFTFTSSKFQVNSIIDNWGEYVNNPDDFFYNAIIIPEECYTPDPPRRFGFATIEHEIELPDSIVLWNSYNDAFSYHYYTDSTFCVPCYANDNVYTDDWSDLKGNNKPIRLLHNLSEVGLVEKYDLDPNEYYSLYVVEPNNLSDFTKWIHRPDLLKLNDPAFDFYGEYPKRLIEILLEDPNLFYIPVFKQIIRYDSVDVKISSNGNMLEDQVLSNEAIWPFYMLSSEGDDFIKQGIPGTYQLGDSTYISINPGFFDRQGGNRIELKTPATIGTYSGLEFDLFIAYNLNISNGNYLYDWGVYGTSETILTIHKYGEILDTIEGTIKGPVIDAVTNERYEIDLNFNVKRLK